MTVPSFLFAFLIAGLYASLYHLVRGGSLGRLVVFLLFSGGGFALGHVVGIWQEWLLFPLGQLNLGMSTLGSLVFLIIGDWGSRSKLGEMQAFSEDENEV